MNALSDAATYERACRYSNNSLWTLTLQCRRLKSQEPEDAEFIFRVWVDFEFFIVALTRLRRAAVLAANVSAIKQPITIGLEIFDSALPGLKSMRDIIAEHFDEYAVDKGRLTNMSRKSLEVGSFDGTTFEWLGYKLDIDIALNSSEKLFTTIQQCRQIIFR